MGPIDRNSCKIEIYLQQIHFSSFWSEKKVYIIKGRLVNKPCKNHKTLEE
uniref:Uncharacterized protein n=1 Tax=Nelumbo nucifera TaxID=4432 RepID=A0A823A2V6_NELNU|nr:TPA_asm: hypothetical protein HUJ06_018355 [Nelumbo nucifera]